MISYLLVLGRTPRLALAELQAFFPQITLINPNVAKLEDPAKSFSPGKFSQILGGTVKIAQVIDQVPRLTPEILGASLLKTNQAGRRLVFGVSVYETNFLLSPKFLAQIKQFLEKQGFSGRFVSSPQSEPLSSVVVAKQAVNELIVVKDAGQFLLGKTLAVQPFEEWNKRDYSRPYADPRAGMLPPKVARMAVNLALGINAKTKVLLDPFCGMGTILAEAALSGAAVIGSDQVPEAVHKARKNLAWLTTQYPEVNPAKLKFLVSDATHISEKLPKSSVDAIVTETFMGEANSKFLPRRQADKMQDVNLEEIKNTIKGLEKLYIGCLRDWQNILKPKAKVVIALPEYSISGKTYFVKKAVDNCETLGYTVKAGPIEYSRPQAVVRRKFYVLEKK